MDKTYLEELTTTSPPQFQDFINILMIIDARRVDGVEKKLLEAR
jgi:hypothetical protein